MNSDAVCKILIRKVKIADEIYLMFSASPIGIFAILPMAIPVEECSREGYKIRKVFG